jgi:peptide deformylase
MKFSKPKLTVLVGDTPELRRVATEVDPATLALPETQQLIDELFETMETSDGIGLAAPQVGISVRMVIVVLGGTGYCLVNPRITRRSKDLVKGEEGCLSFPGLFGDVVRNREIEFVALDRQGQEINQTVSDLDARVIQHELDHLDGVLLPDRIKEKIKAPKVALRGRSL